MVKLNRPIDIQTLYVWCCYFSSAFFFSPSFTFFFSVLNGRDINDIDRIETVDVFLPEYVLHNRRLLGVVFFTEFLILN